MGHPPPLGAYWDSRSLLLCVSRFQTGNEEFPAALTHTRARPFWANRCHRMISRLMSQKRGRVARSGGRWVTSEMSAYG